VSRKWAVPSKLSHRECNYETWGAIIGARLRTNLVLQKLLNVIQLLYTVSTVYRLFPVELVSKADQYCPHLEGDDIRLSHGRWTDLLPHCQGPSNSILPNW
jgi:hypothetical protein